MVTAADARKQTDPLVSVIVLTYKKFDNLVKNITSVIEQTYPRIELIVQDDGSGIFPAGEASDLLRSAAHLEKYRIYENPENLGTVKNYNLAISRASGEIILPLSQDDIFADNMAVSSIVQYMQATGCAVCTAKRMGRESRDVLPRPADIDYFKTADKRKLLLRMMYRNFISGAVMYFVKDAFYREGAPVFDERFLLMEDWPFLLTCIDRDVKIGFLDRVTAVFGEDGVSHQKLPSLKYLRDLKLLYEDYILPKSRQCFGEKTRMYLEYQYGKILDQIKAHGSEEGASGQACGLSVNPIKLKALLLRMSIYAKIKGADPITARMEYLLRAEDKRC